ncbi:AmmeMemoRadiSam system protein B [Enterovirga rhinocerotis]|uniref:Poly-gamma-glutamate synthesis protein (Capsule biosynthesis protein) n=1 Tax=Enterovirga rhinocerotis TaxID=1339210 RepID=A0A4R7C828_9HYPH|nr:AmmeMemoRadiSam system protein B [Enterovirga rhinocerotis]TDR94598.1 poly-gamma-glutamate synthesis protein (capsule biosynthesis protein) [Enterovirga rhinocerotis]
MTRGVLLALLFLFVTPARADLPPIPSLYDDPAPFRAAIAKERLPVGAASLPVTGIGVPHHLLAADLMARGFAPLKGQSYDRVILISPDHFNRTRRPFATTRRDFETVFGRVATDAAAAEALLRAGDLVEDSDLFEKEHGVVSLLPFLKDALPEVPVVALAISIRADRADWDRVLALLRPLVGPRTLVVQSTDYSHYLPPAASLQRDQETLNVIAAGDIEAVTRLISSDHMDSRAAQYIQMRLQEERGSRATVIGSRNSIEYVPHASRTTSYIVTVYSPERAAFPHSYPDQDVVVFAGDLFAGRYLTKPLADPRIAADLVGAVRKLTGGAPLVVNLEGAVLRQPPEGLPDNLHAMHAGLAIPLLKALNVRAASLANNHSHDLGRDGYRESIAVLKAAGITPLVHGAAADLGPLRVVAVNLVGRNDRAGFPVSHPKELGWLCRVPAAPPLLAFVHWGVEYETILRPEERQAAEALHRCGAGIVVGAHSHRGTDLIEAPAGGAYALVPSLGNFLFDQTASRGSGVLLEVRRFRQGTVATRILPLPNLFDRANALMREQD